MDGADYLRVVALRKGKLRVSEFRLRSGERGLSLFASPDNPKPADIMAAVRSAGKQGDLAVAALSESDLRGMGLALVATPGETAVPEVNALHAEARIPFWRTLLLRLRGRPIDEYFNDHVSDRLLEIARILK